MAEETICPRCGYRNSFLPGYLSGTCVCRMCQSQLDWREIPGAGPDCKPARVPHPLFPADMSKYRAPEESEETPGPEETSGPRKVPDDESNATPSEPGEEPPDA